MALPVFLALLLVAPPSVDDFPFEALANELFALERPELVPEPRERPSPEERMRQRLAGSHVKVPLGAIELWIPVETLASPGRSVPGLEVREAAVWSRELVELQRRWLTRMGLEPDQIELANDDLDEVEGWVKSFRRARALPELKPETNKALVRVAAALLTTPETERVEARTLPPLVILIAPTRTHYGAVLGAIGVELPGLRQRLWTDHTARTMNQFPGWRTALVGMTFSPATGAGPVLLDAPADSKELTQTIVHLASLLLTYNLSMTLPSWFGEGIAIGDTVAITGADETIFSGHKSSEEDRALAQLFDWLYAEHSPYRNGPSRRLFLRELKKAHDDRGFRILDLVKGGVGLHTHGPFLGPTIGREATLVNELTQGPPGVRNGFAEFLRAYGAAFIHWLGDDENDPVPRLDLLLAEIRLLCMGRHPEPRRPLSKAVEQALGRTLGVAKDTGADIEAEFLEWLVGRGR